MIEGSIDQAMEGKNGTGYNRLKIRIQSKALNLTWFRGENGLKRGTNYVNPFVKNNVFVSRVSCPEIIEC